ncbi:hypothetical protein BCR34DRAFT_603795 [Clohesyomyces aquaticus]|uniref:Uncharacterized protein n=1 Tax=Clohesyomyces aquaticus TaxID=1231657 RepID=A0A1Y1ZC14_9PLEO|nr:hypothetical protein BCR34DRAFT_603795 [Clohesyomyces aquaticus]
MVELLEGSSSASRGGRTVRELLEIPNDGGFTVFALLLTDGYTQDRLVADELRKRYELEYDLIAGPGKHTLTGAIIMLSNYQGLMGISNVRYLLSLSPKLSFIDGLGSSLLAIAVSGPLQNASSDQRRADIIRLLLRHYPEYKRLSEHGPGKLGAVHTAAYYGNTTALRIFNGHVQAMQPLRKLPYNEVQEGQTMLDGLVRSFANLLRIQKPGGNLYQSPESSDQEVTDSYYLHSDLDMNRNQIAHWYKILREDGALHKSELGGTMRWGRMLPVKLMPKSELLEFMERATTNFGLDPWKFDEEPVLLQSDGSDDTDEERAAFSANFQQKPWLATHTEIYTAFELRWIQNYFCLSGRELHFSGLRLLKEQKKYILKHTEWNGLYEIRGGEFPFESTEYEIVLSKHQERVSWTRPGRRWTRVEEETLRQSVGDEWLRIFGERWDAWESLVRRYNVPILCSPRRPPQ